MHRVPFVAVVIALACTACSKEAAKSPPARVEAEATPEATAPPAPPPPASDVATPAEPTVAPMPEPAPAAAPAPPPPERVVRVVPARERRIHALINNAISRDVTGHTEDAAAMWESRRAACKTQACVDRAYAAQETELRKWEGSEAIR
jgi:hypothetical protein